MICRIPCATNYED